MSVWGYGYYTTTLWRSTTGDLFQRNIDGLSKEDPNVFYIADVFLIVGYDDGTDHGTTLCKVLQKCRKENLKLNKDKCHFRCTSIPFFGQIISRHGVNPAFTGCWP